MLSQFPWGFDKWQCCKLGKCCHCFYIICSECHLVVVLHIAETNNCTFVVVRRAETGFLNGIVRGTCGYVRYGQVQQILCRLCCISMEMLQVTMQSMLYQYGQVLDDYVDYVVLTQFVFCLLLNIVVIEHLLSIVLVTLIALCSFCL